MVEDTELQEQFSRLKKAAGAVIHVSNFKAKRADYSEAEEMALRKLEEVLEGVDTEEESSVAPAALESGGQLALESGGQLMMVDKEADKPIDDVTDNTHIAIVWGGSSVI